MDETSLIKLIRGGETSHTQFRENLSNRLSAAQELVAFANTDFVEEKYKSNFEEYERSRLLSNLRLGDGERLNIAGALLFAKHPEKVLPQFYISAVWFAGTHITGEKYLSSEDIRGTLSQCCARGLDFLKRALNRPQNGKDFNSLGD